MDWMTPLGFLIGFSTVGYTLVKGQSVGLILNMHAFLLVYGGTLGATLLTYPQNVLVQALRAVRIFLIPGNRPSAPNVVALIVRLAEKARRQGMESLQPDITQLQIPFLAAGLRMVLDGLPVDIVRNNLMK